MPYLPVFIYSLRYDNWVIVHGILNSIDVSFCLPRTPVADGTVSNFIGETALCEFMPGLYVQSRVETICVLKVCQSVSNKFYIQQTMTLVTLISRHIVISY